MTRAMQSRAAASQRQVEPLTIARAGDHLSTEQWLNRRAGVAAFSRDRKGHDPGLSAVSDPGAEAWRVEQLENHIRRGSRVAPVDATASTAMESRTVPH